ncbi:helix-turn-helix transcriptional regulator [Streptomyces sp. QH1-20]|uniref:helix-turn-helix transcriptional regulator n=1 Tax=Streptomyces sp. QH1-20 TaxID=3240934 RepID=UPI003517A2C3
MPRYLGGLVITGVTSAGAARGGGLVPAVLSTKQAAIYLGVAEATLRTWRHRRRGPRSFRIEGHVVYRRTALVAYLDACEAADSRSNSELNPLNLVAGSRRDRSGERPSERRAA